jgi:transcriptional regulator with XRE-family HTH domain
MTTTTLTDDELRLATLGAHLHELRIERGWTLDDLAARTALSQAHLSRIESGERQPSLATLFTLAGAFNVSVASFFDSAPGPDACVVVRAGSVPEQRINDLVYTPLTGGHRPSNLQAVRVTIPAHRRGTERYQHEGEEWLYVLSGALQLMVGDQTYLLQPGDVAHFDASKPHRLATANDAAAEALLLTCTAPQPLLGEHT